MGSQNPIDLTRVRPDALSAKLRRVRGYAKTTSIIWLRALKIPTLKGLAIPKWSNAAAHAVERFARSIRSGKVLIRYDHHGERWTNRRGGYVAAISEVEAIVRSVQGEGTLVLCLEPASPFSDLYSLAAITDPDKNKISVEVVGPGFDASDILRGDVQVHERFEVGAKCNYNDLLVRGRVVSVDQTFLVSKDQYVRSVKTRLQKIAAKLQNPTEAPMVGGRGNRTSIASAERYLKRVREQLLLEHRRSYVPIPPRMLNTFLQYVLDTLHGLALRGVHLGPTSFAASFISAKRIVVWDFFPARREELSELSEPAVMDKVTPGIQADR